MTVCSGTFDRTTLITTYNQGNWQYGQLPVHWVVVFTNGMLRPRRSWKNKRLHKHSYFSSGDRGCVRLTLWPNAGIKSVTVISTIRPIGTFRRVRVLSERVNVLFEMADRCCVPLNKIIYDHNGTVREYIRQTRVWELGRIE